MAYLLSLLPVLLCPLSMGLMFWLMRDQRHNSPRQPAETQRLATQTDATAQRTGAARPAPSAAARFLRLFHLCIDWRAVTLLILVGVGVWLVAPNMLVAALPLLLVAVCPLSMLLMMRGMPGHVSREQPPVAPRSEPAYQAVSSVQDE